jgi:hypothetical protein
MRVRQPSSSESPRASHDPRRAPRSAPEQPAAYATALLCFSASSSEGEDEGWRTLIGEFGLKRE